MSKSVGFPLMGNWTRQCRNLLGLTPRRFNFSASSASSLTRVSPKAKIQHRISALGLHQQRAQLSSRAKGTAHSFTQWVPEIGAEPGINSSTDKPTTGGFEQRHREECEIRVIDYSNQQIVSHEVATPSFETFLKDQPRPKWAACRWIYVNGLNWDVIKCLGNSNKIHPLALEDVLDTRTPTKVNWYEGHCFLEMNMVKLVHLGADRKEPAPTDATHSAGHEHLASKERPRQRVLSPGKYSMQWEQVSAFLTTDKTVITIFEHSGNDVFAPIWTRLQSSQTVVRSSNDPSILLQAVIDTVVDLSLPIGRAVSEIFDQLEYSVLSNPTIPQSRQLHVLRSGLTLLMNNTNAIGSLVRTLCDHRAVSDSMEAQRDALSPLMPSIQAPLSVQISPLAHVYFQDVQDHISALSNSTHMSIRAAENLSSLIFNTIAASQNESVRKLTLVSSFFLPLTFLTGYFGMNFDPMPVVNNHSDVYFWYIATPVMLIALLTLMPRSQRFRLRAWRKRPQ